PPMPGPCCIFPRPSGVPTTISCQTGSSSIPGPTPYVTCPISEASCGKSTLSSILQPTPAIAPGVEAHPSQRSQPQRNRFLTGERPRFSSSSIKEREGQGGDKPL